MYAPAHDDEITTLTRYVDQQLEAIRSAALGLTEEQPRSTPRRSALSIGGILKHVTYGMRGALGRFRGEAHRPMDADAFAAYMAGFTVAEGETVADTLAEFDSTRADLLAALATADPASEATEPPAPWDGIFDARPIRLRYYLGHLIEEYARHAGHADIIREQIDGVSVPVLDHTLAGTPANDFFSPYAATPGTLLSCPSGCRRRHTRPARGSRTPAADTSVRSSYPGDSGRSRTSRRGCRTSRCRCRRGRLCTSLKQVTWPPPNSLTARYEPERGGSGAGVSVVITVSLDGCPIERGQGMPRKSASEESLQMSTWSGSLRPRKTLSAIYKVVGAGVVRPDPEADRLEAALLDRQSHAPALVLGAGPQADLGIAEGDPLGIVVVGHFEVEEVVRAVPSKMTSPSPAALMTIGRSAVPLPRR